MNSARKSNIELLRVFSMLMIVSYHYAIHGIYQSLWGGIRYIGVGEPVRTKCSVR